MLTFVLEVDGAAVGRFSTLEGISDEQPRRSLVLRGPCELSQRNLQHVAGVLAETAIVVVGAAGETLARLELGITTPALQGAGLRFDGAADLALSPHTIDEWRRWPGPREPARWTSYTTAQRRALLTVTRLAWCASVDAPAPCGTAFELDGRGMLDTPSVFLALGESLFGLGGYAGADLDGVHDRLGALWPAPQRIFVHWKHPAHRLRLGDAVSVVERLGDILRDLGFEVSGRSLR